MNRGFVIAGALAAAAAVAIVSVRACAAVPAAESYAWESASTTAGRRRPPRTKGRRSRQSSGTAVATAMLDLISGLTAEETRVHRVRAHPGDWGPTHTQHPALLHDAGTASADLHTKSSDTIQGREHAAAGPRAGAPCISFFRKFGITGRNSAAYIQSKSSRT